MALSYKQRFLLSRKNAGSLSLEIALRKAMLPGSAVRCLKLIHDCGNRSHAGRCGAKSKPLVSRGPAHHVSVRGGVRLEDPRSVIVDQRWIVDRCGPGGFGGFET